MPDNILSLLFLRYKLITFNQISTLYRVCIKYFDKFKKSHILKDIKKSINYFVL